MESDSFNNTYDENATYPVVNVTELKEALTNGGVVNVATDIRTNNSEDTAAARIVISQPTTLNLEKKIITPDNMGNNNTNFCALIVDADTTINAGENGGIDTGVNGGYGINVRKGAAVTINDGYYYGGGTAVQVQEGTLIINGGTFVNFDPSNCTAEGAGTNFVADGYKVVSEAHGADTWYTVVKG